MVNLWEYIDNYIKQSNNSYTYTKEDAVTEMLNHNEKQIYEHIKQSDLERLRRFS